MLILIDMFNKTPPYYKYKLKYPLYLMMGHTHVLHIKIHFYPLKCHTQDTGFNFTSFLALYSATLTVVYTFAFSLCFFCKRRGAFFFNYEYYQVYLMSDLFKRISYSIQVMCIYRKNITIRKTNKYYIY